MNWMGLGYFTVPQLITIGDRVGNTYGVPRPADQVKSKLGRATVLKTPQVLVDM